MQINIFLAIISLLKYNYEEKLFILPNTLIDNYLIDDDQQANEFL